MTIQKLTFSPISDLFANQRPNLTHLISFLFIPGPNFSCLESSSNISSVVEIQRWWVLKSKIFGQESTYSKEFLLKKIRRFIKKCQNCIFKVNFQCQKSTDFFQKKLMLRPNILSKRLGGRSRSRLMKNFGLGLLTD